MTILEEIASLKEMIQRLEDRDVVKEKVLKVSRMLDEINDVKLKKQALNNLVDLTFDLVKDVSDIPEEILEKFFEKSSLKNEKTSVCVNVKEYIDVIFLDIDKRLPYRELHAILKRTVKDFDDKLKDVASLSCNKNDLCVHMRYICDKHKTIIIDISDWGLKDESLEVYLEGLTEYLQK